MPDANSSHSRARHLLEIGRYADARRSFLEVLEQTGPYAELLAEISLTFELEKNWDEAENWAQDALGAPGDLGYAYQQAGRVDLVFGRFDEALEMARKAIAAEPEESRNFVLAARAMTLQGALKRARKMAQQGLQLDPSDENCRLILAGLEGLINPVLSPEDDERTEIFLRDFPERAEAHSMRGWTRCLLDPKAARQDFEQALELDPDRESARCGLLLTLRSSGPSGASLEMFDIRNSRDPMGQVVSRACLLLITVYNVGKPSGLSLSGGFLLGLLLFATWSSTTRVRGNFRLGFGPYAHYLTPTERWVGRATGFLLLLALLPFTIFSWKAAVLAATCNLLSLMPLGTVDLESDKLDRAGILVTLGFLAAGWIGSVLMVTSFIKTAWAAWLVATSIFVVGFYGQTTKIKMARGRL